MKKVLILCDNFPPQSGPRMGYLVKYLSRMGWEAYVVTAENKSRNDLTGLTGYAKELYVIPQKPHRKWNLLHILPFFWPYDYLRGEYDIRKKALEIVNREKIDIILCSRTFGSFLTNVAAYISKLKGIPYVIDIRDLSEQNANKSFWSRNFNSKMDFLREKCSVLSRWRSTRVLRRASALTTISPWHTRYLKGKTNPNTYCIYNGFDPEVFGLLTPEKNDVFEMVYTGTLATKSLRDYTFLVEAISSLAKKNLIKSETFKLKFYSGNIMSENRIKEDFEAAGIKDFVEFLPFVPLCEIPAIFKRASTLIVLTAKSGKDGVHGIMTTKFFEYLASGRPILCIPSDEECLEAAIKETNSGCAPRTSEEAESYILSLYNEWKEKGVTEGKTKQDKLALFSRETQAKQFAELFSIISSNQVWEISANEIISCGYTNSISLLHRNMAYSTDVKKAIKRAKKLYDEFVESKNAPHAGNPCTLVFLLVDKLLKQIEK